MDELKRLMEMAAKQQGGHISVCFIDGKWSVRSHSVSSGYVSTFEEVVELLKKWGEPGIPPYLLLYVPYGHVSWYAREGKNPEFRETCQQAIAEYEPGRKQE